MTLVFVLMNSLDIFVMVYIVIINHAVVPKSYIDG